MVNTQEIIERSVYSAILSVAVINGYSLDPNNYLPITEQKKLDFEEDKLAITTSGKKFISIYGAGNSQSKGEKISPRIVVDPQGFFPGDIGFPKTSLDKTDTGYLVSESNYTETVDILVNISLVANNIADMRILHNILNSAIPQRGYIKPYTHSTKPFDGNIFIELNNFYQLPDNDKGIIEKVYQFTIKDTVLEELFLAGDEIAPLIDIQMLVGEFENLTKVVTT